MLRASALAGASRRLEMRKPKRALNLPMIIGQNPMAGNRVSLANPSSTALVATSTPP
jgi:hypothetical protein